MVLERRLESRHSNLTRGSRFARLPPMFEEWASLYDSVYAAKGKDYAAEAEYLQRWMAPTPSVHVSAQTTSDRARGELPTARRALGDVTVGQRERGWGHTHLIPGVAEPDLPALLDVACGTGEHLAQLSREFQLFGVDSSPEMLSVARHKLPGASLFLSDMTSFELGRTFSVVTCLFSSIGYLRSVSMLERAVERMSSHLAEDGVLLIEPPIPPERLDPPETISLRFRHGSAQWEREASARTEGERLHIRFTYRVVGDEPSSADVAPTEIVDNQTIRLFSGHQIATAMERAGLEVEHDSRGPTGLGLWIGRKP